MEFFYSYRTRNLSRFERWPTNLMIILVDVILLKIFFPMGIVGVAEWAKLKNFGLFNFLNLNHAFFAVFSFILLDLGIYLQHVYSHKWNLLWRFHRVHHSDLDLDVTSALRFHPVEILYSALYKILIILLFGISPEVVLIFEIVLNAMAMFNHSNLYIPEKLETFFRVIFVTPQMHIIHHSVEKIETDSNYGFNFSCWDFLFKTYNQVFLSAGEIGQKNLSSRKKQRFLRLMLQPWKDK